MTILLKYNLTFWSKHIEPKSAKLVLEDGSVYDGISFGYPKSVAGETVFSTGMVGYPESLTDPSYQGQILVLTYPLIGNYGMPPHNNEDQLQLNYESPRGKVSGLVVADYSTAYSHWNSESGLAQWLYNQQIPAISGIDTRSLTKRLREKGAMLGRIIIEESDIDFYDPNNHNLVEQVSIEKPELYSKGDKRVLLIDCGCKHNIIREMANRDVEVLRVPWDYPLVGEFYNGVLISSGPGDPKMCLPTVKEVQSILNKGTPTFGICLGHQIMALAITADTNKMKYGHRSQNQPVMDTRDKHCFVTTQNHGYVVNAETLPKDWDNLFVNLNDSTCEGLIHKSGRFFSTQFHPEAMPGPWDTTFLFDKFIKSIYEKE